VWAWESPQVKYVFFKYCACRVSRPYMRWLPVSEESDAVDACFVGLRSDEARADQLGARRGDRERREEVARAQRAL